MSSETLLDKITTIFGTRNQFFYHYLWIAEIKNYYACKVVIAGVKTRSNEMRGLLLVPTLLPPREREFGGPNPISYVSLKDWDDPVKQAIQSMDLIAEKEVVYVVDNDSVNYFFNLHIFSEKLITDLSYGPGPTADPTLVRLWESLKLATKVIADAYQNEEMNKCVETFY